MNAKHDTSTTHDDRENLLLGLRALCQQCRKIVRESKRLQTCVWKGFPVTVAWRLDFREESLTFNPWVKVIPHKSGRPSLRDLKVLTARLMNRLTILKEHEPWPITIPAEWLEE